MPRKLEEDFSVFELEEPASELDDISSTELDERSVSELERNSLEEDAPWAIVFSISVVPLTFDDSEQANNKIAPNTIRFFFMFIPFNPS